MEVLTGGQIVANAVACSWNSLGPCGILEDIRSRGIDLAPSGRILDSTTGSHVFLLESRFRS